MLDSYSMESWQLSSMRPALGGMIALFALLFCSHRLHAQQPATSSTDQPCEQLSIQPALVGLKIPESEASRLLIHKVKVKYPGAAKAAHISGTVMLQATISKTGEISNIRPLCGPKILQEACLKAVRKWKYRPYLVNGEAVELETTITSVFKLGDT